MSGHAGMDEGVAIGAAQPWLLVVLTGVAYLLNYVDRQTIFSIFPILKTDLGFSDAQLGLTGSMFLWAYGISSPLAGWLADHYPKYKIIFLSVIWWSTVTVLTGMTHSPYSLLACRGLMGITEALFLPAAVALISQLTGSSTRSRSIGFIFAAQIAGLALGGWYGGYVGQRHGWRIGFIALGSIGVAYAVPYAIYLKKINRRMVEVVPAPRGDFSWLELFRIPTYLYLCICFPVYNALLWLLYTWLPYILFTSFHLSLTDAGFTAAVYMQCATLVGLLAGGVVSDALCAAVPAIRFWLLCCGIAFSSLCSYGIAHSSGKQTIELSIVGVGLGGGLFIANLMACALDVVPPNGHGLAIGTINIVGAPISGLAALLGGSLNRSVGVAAVIATASIVSICAACFLALGVRAKFQIDHARAIQINR
jgi:MFS family permease